MEQIVISLKKMTKHDIKMLKSYLEKRGLNFIEIDDVMW